MTVTFQELQNKLMAAAEEIPPPSDVQLENDLNPSPASLAFRIARLEQWARKIDPTYDIIVVKSTNREILAKQFAAQQEMLTAKRNSDGT
jgi:hypothetical protein